MLYDLSLAEVDVWHRRLRQHETIVFVLCRAVLHQLLQVHYQLPLLVVLSLEGFELPHPGKSVRGILTMQLMKYLMQEIIMIDRGGQGIRGLASAFDLLGTIAKHLISLVRLLDHVTAFGVTASSFKELLLQPLILN